MGNIIVPDMGKDTNTFGEVVSVGDGNFTFPVIKYPTQLKVGDRVVLGTQGVTELPFNGEEFSVAHPTLSNKIDSEISLEDAAEHGTELSEQDKTNLTEI